MAGRPEEASNPNAADRERDVPTNSDREAPTQFATRRERTRQNATHPQIPTATRPRTSTAARAPTSNVSPPPTRIPTPRPARTATRRSTTTPMPPKASCIRLVSRRRIRRRRPDRPAAASAANCPGSPATRSWACWAPAAWGSCTRRGTSGSTAWSRSKMIKAGAGAQPDDLARFEAEARAVAAIDHPNIIKIFEIGEHDGLPYFSLEFLEGGSLAQRIAGKPQPIEDAARIVETLARAMDVAHRRGIVHRDIKPANVLLAGDGTPKIADFGLVKRLEADSAPDWHRVDPRLAELHGPRADHRRREGRPRRRPVRAGRHPLRDAHRPATVSRVVNPGHPRPDPYRRAGRSVAAPAPHAPRPGDDLPEGAAKGPGSALPRRRGDGRRPPPFPRRRADRGPARLRPRARVALVPAQPGRGALARRGGGLALAGHGRHVVLRDPGQQPRARRTRQCPAVAREEKRGATSAGTPRKAPLPRKTGKRARSLLSSDGSTSSSRTNPTRRTCEASSGTT